MKITRTSREYKSKRQLKEEALRGCDVCPCCGETKKYLDYLKDDVMGYGILQSLSRHWYKDGKQYTVDCFSCETCGAAWESEPYEGWW